MPWFLAILLVIMAMSVVALAAFRNIHEHEGKLVGCCEACERECILMS